ncbi:hypothetical protein DSAG12_02561 [Promethearchaeum syntrophicum]|uniref:Uncharacterized protein n=1 Tax=Promethearchaeum syntrophicum TaxID=2594042 RepID=A0A5B9DCG4_9ARCH|nr:hypothetical protein [Candidatus Prometheoarchaeum syntrophicum]QEE16731.1 hypothetical protein DSAG12_02561 [Candidatus Prometheoarchaeum syntrophicum]
MKHFWIINSYSSVALFYRNYSNFTLDQDLISGFLMALNSFSEVELKSHGISSIIMGGLSWVYYDPRDSGLMFVAADDVKSNTEVMRSRLEVIFKMFVQQYDITSKKMQSLVDQSKYVEFQETLDMLEKQWKQAETILEGGAALIFDLLGIFQQLFNQFNHIIQTTFFKEENEKVMDQIGEMLENLNTMPEFTDNPELSNISFDEHGWDIITLNPLKIELDVLKRTLTLITIHLNNVLKENLTDYGRMNAYINHLFPYIMAQYELLENLGVLHDLLRIFLQ